MPGPRDPTVLTRPGVVGAAFRPRPQLRLRLPQLPQAAATARWRGLSPRPIRQRLVAHNLFVHRCAQGPQADTDAQRQQPVLRGVTNSPSAACTLSGRPSSAFATCCCCCYTVPHGGSPRLDGLARTCHGPSRTGRGGRTATDEVYRRRDNVLVGHARRYGRTMRRPLRMPPSIC